MRTRRRLVLLPLALLGTFLAVNAAAQEPAVKQGEFTVQRFEAAAGSKNFLTVQTARMDGQIPLRLLSPLH